MLKAVYNFILGLLFPSYCVSCEKEGDFLCSDCLASLKKRKMCEPINGLKKTTEFEWLDGVIYALDYAKNRPIKQAVKQLKYRFTKELATHFAELMAEKMAELAMAKDRPIVLIPVPLHQKRLNYRGFNQAELVAKGIQQKLGKDRVEILPLLQRIKETSQQASLDKTARQKNIQEAFTLNKKIIHKYQPQKLYFIVDDVCTTGATLEACGQALKKAGFIKIYGLVIARAFLKDK